MAPLIHHTNRLILKVEDETKARHVLDLYLRNRANFERFEPTRPANFYTLDFHSTMLRREYIAYNDDLFVRYFIYRTYNTTRIIGSINFNFKYDELHPYAEIGYKVDALYQNQGIAYEACLAAIKVIISEYNFSRIDARIHPDNIASIKLATKLGFSPVKIEPKSAHVNGKKVDLIRYSLNTSNIQ